MNKIRNIWNLPGIGMTSGPWAVSQAKDNCPGVHPFLAAISATASTSLRFMHIFPSENLGIPKKFRLPWYMSQIILKCAILKL